MKARFGMIGLGSIANRFATVLNTSSEGELVSVAAKDLDRAKAFAEKHGAKKAYGAYVDIVNDPEVDIIYIATTHNFHYEIAKLCVEHGKAVICEKPFFLTKKEAESLAALAKEKKVLVMEAMWTRCLPTFQKAKEWAQDGTIGQVKFIDASFSFNCGFDAEMRLFNPKIGGGSLYDAGVYPIEFITGIVGQKPDEIKALVVKGKTGVDEYATIGMSFAGGTLATARCGISVGTNIDAHIYGTEGKIIVREFLSAKVCELYDREGALKDTFTADFEDGFIFEIDHVAGLFKEGKLDSSYIPISDTIDCAELFDIVKEQCNLI